MLRRLTRFPPANLIEVTIPHGTYPEWTLESPPGIEYQTQLLSPGVHPEVPIRYDGRLGKAC